MLLKHTKVA